MEVVVIVFGVITIGLGFVFIGYFLGKQYSSKINSINLERIELRNRIIKEKLDFLIKDRDRCIQYSINLDIKLVKLQRENLLLKYKENNGLLNN
jgi:hypothetical protein